MKMTHHKFMFLIFISFLTVGCENTFDYSPYAIDFNEDNRNVNQKNIEKLMATECDDTLTIAFTGDTHNFFDETEQFVETVNQNPAIDFVIHVGDIADFGLPKQFLWGNSILSKLAVPYFIVIGNHDLIGNGSEAYQEMFGAFDYSFIYNKIKFVFINTNSLEFEYCGTVPDIRWHEGQLIPTEYFTKAIVIFHTPPSDIGFDASLTEDFHQTLGLYHNVLFVVHGHLHHHEIYYPFEGNVTYVNVYGVEHNKFNVIQISVSTYEIETIGF